MREAVEAIPGVSFAAAWRYAQFSEMESVSGGQSTNAQPVGVEPARLPSFLSGITIIAGSLSLPRGTVAVTEDVARQLNVTAGGTARFVVRSYNTTGNETVTRLDVTIGGIFRIPAPTGGVFYSPATSLIQIGDIGWYEQQLGVSYGGNSVQSENQNERGSFFYPHDLTAPQRNPPRPAPPVDEVLLPLKGPERIHLMSGAPT